MDYKRLKEEGRKLLAEGALQECLHLFENALRLNPKDEKIRTKVESLREALKQRQNEDADEDQDSAEEAQKSEDDIKDEVGAGMSYDELKREGKKLLQAGAYEECYQMFERALQLNPTDERIQRKVESLREALDEQRGGGDSDGEQKSNEDYVEVCPGYFLHRKIHSKLFPYQRKAIEWMYSLFKRKKGGILGDDMGLGKTVQVISFLAGLFDMDKISSVLLVMPVSLIGNWMNEFEKWAPGISVYDYHSSTKAQKDLVLRKVMNRGGVILTTYGLITTRSDVLCERGGRKFIWDYVILDEGHRIKNPTKTQKAVFGLLAKNRLILTGTAVQNNLSELWSLFHFAHQGTLFGNLAGFRHDFEGPINRGRERDAKPGEREMGVQLALQLKQMIQPYFLRRTKAEVFRTGEGPKVEANKEDLVLWTYLSETQQQLYREFLESDSVKDILMSSKSPLVQLNILKKICDHPRLLPKKACVQLGLCDTMTEEEIREFLEDDNHCPFSIDDVSDEDLLQESGKMKLTLELVQNLRSTGHRTLIFSTSKRILDMIQRILRMRKFSIARLDGSVTKPSERNLIVQDFQRSGKDVFLLTTQVGGVGLTLTNADRVIIYDPNWNPATDAQAVDRAFRIGQTRDVYVYRLITCGTIEEKIYSRQVFKDSIIKQTTGKLSDPTRYFTRSQLRELFVLNDPLRSETQLQLQQMHEKELPKECEKHIDFLMSTKMVFGVSHHDLLFSTEEEKEPVPEVQMKFITQQVTNAREIRQREAEVLAEDLQRNPHIVPILDPKTAFARNRAAAMPSTVNPSDLYDRPKVTDSRNSFMNGDVIDLDEDEDDEDQHRLDQLHSTTIEDTKRRSFSEVIVLDDEDDANDISIVKEIKAESFRKSINSQENSDSDIEDITPRELSSSSSKRGSNESRHGTTPREKRARSNTASSDGSPLVLKNKTNRFVIVSDDEDVSTGAGDHAGPTAAPESMSPAKSKRKSVVFTRHSSSDSVESTSEAAVPPTAAPSGSETADEKLIAAQEIAYDEAFEQDNIDETSILETSLMIASSVGSPGADRSWASERSGQPARTPLADRSNATIAESSLIMETDDEAKSADENRSDAVDDSDEDGIEDSDEDL